MLLCDVSVPFNLKIMQHHDRIASPTQFDGRSVLQKVYFIITQTSVQDCKVLHLKTLKDIVHPHSIKFSLSKVRDMAVMDNYHALHHCATDVWVRASEVTPALYWSLNFAEVASYTRNPQIWFLPSAFPISN